MATGPFGEAGNLTRLALDVPQRCLGSRLDRGDAFDGILAARQQVHELVVDAVQLLAERIQAVDYRPVGCPVLFFPIHVCLRSLGALGPE